MIKYALITPDGGLVKFGEFDDAPPDLAPNKGRWVLFVEISAAPSAAQTHDGYTEALEADQWVRRHQVRGLTAAELEARRIDRLRDSDTRDMARMVEDIMVVVATSGGVSLTRDNFPSAVWDKINARRALRGMGPV